MITDPTQLFATLAATTAFLFWLGKRKKFEKFFSILPPIIWVYLVPAAMTTAGLLPATNELYGWMSYYFLPFSLFLLTISVDLRALVSLGRLALIMLMVGTAGIMLGSVVAFVILQNFMPEHGWQSIAALAASWIGGSVNMVAVQQGLEAPASILGPLIPVDTVVGYGWMAILLAMVGIQKRFDHWNGANRSAIDALDARLEELSQKQNPQTVPILALIIALGITAAALSRLAGNWLPVIGDPTIISASTWAILIVVTGGLILSFSPVRKLENSGASVVGYYALFLLLSSIGAQADLLAVMDTPVFLIAGLIMISVHIGLLFLAARILKAPLFFVATGSMANVGGGVSAPIVASVYQAQLAPVGLLMAIGGYIMGIYGAFGLAKILALLAGA